MNRETKRRLVDLDKSRQKRAAESGDPPEFVLGGKKRTLPHSAPLAAMVGFADAQAGDLAGVGRAIRALFGEDSNEVLELGLDIDDLGEILDVYGDSGESEASDS